MFINGNELLEALEEYFPIYSVLEDEDITIEDFRKIQGQRQVVTYIANYIKAIEQAQLKEKLKDTQ